MTQGDRPPAVSKAHCDSPLLQKGALPIGGHKVFKLKTEKLSKLRAGKLSSLKLEFYVLTLKTRHMIYTFIFKTRKNRNMISIVF